MLKVWIVAFLLGVLLARLGASALVGREALGTMALAASLLVLGVSVRHVPLARRPVAARVGTAILGCLWGLAHAAPFPRADVTGAVVVKTAVSDATKGPVIVRADGRHFEVYGPQRVGVVGDVRVMSVVRLFGEERGVLRATGLADPPADGLFPHVRNEIRAFFARRASALSPFYRRWVSGLVLGEIQVLPPDVRDAFKRTGLYHLLVVSGLHVTLMAAIFAAMLRAPVQLAYALRLIRPGRWRHLVAGLEVLAGAAAMVYLAVTGSSAAAQRSALLFVVWRGAQVFGGVRSVPTRLCIAAALQILIFPVGFVGEASLMSWAAYLLVLRPPTLDEAEPPLLAPLRTALAAQAILMLLVAAVFGQLALVGLIANLVLIPAFPLLLTTAFWALAFPELPTVSFCLAIQRNYIALVHLFDGLCDVVPWLSVAPESMPGSVRGLCAAVSAWALLNRCRELTISPMDGSQRRGRYDGQTVAGQERGDHRRLASRTRGAGRRFQGSRHASRR